MTYLRLPLFIRRFLKPPLPPARLRGGSGPGEFEAAGRDFMEIFREHAGLKPDERVLDVGCAVGRMARPLIGYLRQGSYEGFDIVREPIGWCKTCLTPLHPRFRFRHVDLFNSYYNPTGSISAESFAFPYADGEFDFVFLTSVFTHMFSRDTANYLSEVGRVLRPGGRVLATFFLLDEHSLKLVELGTTDVPFDHEWEHGRVGYPDQPELAVSYDLSWVESTLEDAGLALRRPVLFGSWAEREGALSYQDIIIADRQGDGLPEDRGIHHEA